MCPFIGILYKSGANSKVAIDRFKMNLNHPTKYIVDTSSVLTQKENWTHRWRVYNGNLL